MLLSQELFNYFHTIASKSTLRHLLTMQENVQMKPPTPSISNSSPETTSKLARLNLESGHQRKDVFQFPRRLHQISEAATPRPGITSIGSGGANGM